MADSEDNGEHQQAEILTCEDCGHRWPAIVTYYQSPTEFPSMNPGVCPECDGAPQHGGVVQLKEVKSA